LKKLKFDLNSVVLIDVCSGKGFGVTLLSFMFPSLQIYMVDMDLVMNISHVKSLPNVHFICMDVHSKTFENWLQSTLNGKNGILMGTHLCGQLSPHFIQLYNQEKNAKAMILAPCCLNKKENKIRQVAKNLNVDHFMYWTLYLFSLIQYSRKNILIDDNVISQKNTYLCAVKNDT